MHWLEAPSFSDKVQSKIAANDDQVGDKLAREAWVIGAGLTNGIAEGAQQSWEDPQGTAGRVGLSLGIGVALGLAQRTAGMSRLAAEAVVTGFGFAFASDALTPSRWQAVENALADTWNAPGPSDRNALVISNQLGRFVFDVGLTMAGTLAGAKVAQRFMQHFQPPAVPVLDQGFSMPEQPSWAPAGQRFKTMPMSQAEVDAVRAGNTPVEPIIVRVGPGASPKAAGYEVPGGVAFIDSRPTVPVQAATVPAREVARSKSPVTSMPAVTGMRESANGEIVLELADGTTITTKKPAG